jgi:hypothetical protein
VETKSSPQHTHHSRYTESKSAGNQPARRREPKIKSDAGWNREATGESPYNPTTKFLPFEDVTLAAMVIGLESGCD